MRSSHCDYIVFCMESQQAAVILTPVDGAGTEVEVTLVHFLNVALCDWKLDLS